MEKRIARRQDRLRRRDCITFSLVSVRASQLSVDLGPLKADLYEAAHRAGVSPSTLARKAIAALLGPTTGENEAAVSRPVPKAGGERGKLDGKVLEVRLKLREEDSRKASECARAEGLSRSEYLAVLVGEAMRGVAKRVGTSANRGGPRSPGRAMAPAGLREALVGSTSQIAALGRNVNQIARSLNGNSGVVSKQSLETLAAVASRVDRHVELAGAVLLALRPVVAARRAITGASDDAPR
jgi:hypothetical protein